MTFKVDKTYPSAVKGKSFCVAMKYRIQDVDCLMVFGCTGNYYPAIIEPDGKTATVLLDKGFTTIYDEGEEE